ncbi:insulinase family protein [bacterium]|nr:insulinase family protein [bacterium]
MRSFNRFMLLLLILSLSGSVLAQRVVRQELDNGLVVVALENHSSPTATVRVYVRTGGAYEGEYQGAGISHFYEHLHGDATTTLAKEEISIWDESLGGASNAWTSKTTTCYYQVTTVEFFDSLVELMAETLLRQDFNDEVITSQKGIITKEINMNNDEAPTRLYYRFLHTLYPDSPVSDPILGYPDMFMAVTEEDLRDYYGERYTPDNMVVVVAGDLSAEEMIAKVKEEFGDEVPSGIEPPTIPSPEPLMGPRYSVEYSTFDTVQFAFGWRTVPLWAEELYPLDILMNALSHGRSSRLYQALREERALVSSVDVSSHTPTYDAGSFAVYLATEPEKLAEAYAVAYDEVMAMRDELLSDEELERVKNGFLANHLFYNEELTDQASQLASDALLGDIEFSTRYVEGCHGVTAEEAREAARKYFSPDNLFVTVLWPASSGEFDPAFFGENLELVESGLSGEKVGYAGWQESLGTVEHGDPDSYFVYQGLSTAMVSNEHRFDHSRVNDLAVDYPATWEFDLYEAGEGGEIELFTLDNGLRLMVLEDHSIGSATVGALIDGGLRAEQPGDAGAMSLIARLLLGGTESRTNEEINLTLEERGGFIHSSTSRDYAQLSAKVLGEDAPLALELITDCLRNSTFPAERIELEREKMLAELAVQKDDPFTQAFKVARKTFFGEHPYGHPYLGEEDSLVALDRDDLLRYHDELLNPEKIILLVSGAVDSLSLYQQLEELWGDLPRSSVKSADPGNPQFSTEEQSITIPTEREQTVLCWYWPGYKLDDGKNYTMHLLDSVLSGVYLPNGRLHSYLRGEGLVYAVHAFGQFTFKPGAFIIYLGTEPGKVERAAEIVRRELDLIASEAVPADELERGKTMLKVSRFVYDLSTASARLNEAAYYELAGLGYSFADDFAERIDEITAEELRSFADELLSQPFTFVQYGNL